MKKLIAIGVITAMLAGGSLVAYAQIDDGSQYTVPQLLQRTSTRLIQLSNRLNDNQRLLLIRRLRAWCYTVETAIVSQQKENERWENSDLPPAAIDAIKDRNAQKVQDAIDSAAGFGSTAVIEPPDL